MNRRLELQHRFDWARWAENEHPSIIEQLTKWLNLVQENDPTAKQWQNCEMEESGIRILMRNQTNGVQENCLVIATIKLPQEIQQKGWFKSFLTHCCNINPWNILVIEDVGNPHLRTFLERLECEVLNNFYATTYIINQPAVHALKAKPLGRYADYLKTTSNS